MKSQSFLNELRFPKNSGKTAARSITLKEGDP